MRIGMNGILLYQHFNALDIRKTIREFIRDGNAIMWILSYSVPSKTGTRRNDIEIITEWLSNDYRCDLRLCIRSCRNDWSSECCAREVWRKCRRIPQYSMSHRLDTFTGNVNMYVCIWGACVHMYKLGQSVYIDVNYVDVHLRGAGSRSSRSEYTYRSSLRLRQSFPNDK